VCLSVDEYMPEYAANSKVESGPTEIGAWKGGGSWPRVYTHIYKKQGCSLKVYTQ